MENDISDVIKNVKNLVDSGNIPDNLKDIISNLQNTNSTSSNTYNNSDISNNTNTNSNSDNKLDTNSSTNDNITSDDLSKILNSFTNSSSNNETNNSNFNSDFDINTILKMKSIISAMNKKDDPRTNLLYSLKPYLRDSRKNKLDQYVNMLNITKMADIFKANNKENNNGT